MKTFYYNGTIITMKETALYAEAVCVENGRIQAVGTLDDVMQYKTDGDEMVAGKNDASGIFGCTFSFCRSCQCNDTMRLVRVWKFFGDCRCHENVCRKKKFIQRCMDRRL